MFKSRTGQVILDCLRKNRIGIILYFAMEFCLMAVFFLYDILPEALIYVSILCFFVLVVMLFVDFLVENSRARKRERAKINILTDRDALEHLDTLADRDYREIIEKVNRELTELADKLANEREETEDYYTKWVHQIKTPISVLKLRLTGESPEEKEILSEIFRIEQYVDMVLQYIRLGSDTNDLVITEYKIDDLVKESVRKFASQFILKKLKLTYEGSGETVITDKKWFLCILEQLISNAIKYTNDGEIIIKSNPHELIVEDTGIGIAQEDIPRIFEKGFTGNNGRIGEKSSGLGLYLCNKAAKKLAVSVICESEMGKGSKFSIRY